MCFNHFFQFDAARVVVWMSRWFNVYHTVIRLLFSIWSTPETRVWAHCILLMIFIVHHWDRWPPWALYARVNFSVLTALCRLQGWSLFSLIFYLFLMESIEHIADLVCWLVYFGSCRLFPLVKWTAFSWFLVLGRFDSLLFHELMLGLPEWWAFNRRFGILSRHTFLRLRHHLREGLGKRSDWLHAWGFCALYSL